MVSEQVHCWRPASSLPHTTCILSEFGFLPSGMVYFAFFQQPVSNKFMCSLFCILYFGIGSPRGQHDLNHDEQATAWSGVS